MLNGQEAVVKLLVEKDVEVDSKDSSGRTPPSWAAEKGHETVVKLPGIMLPGLAWGHLGLGIKTPPTAQNKFLKTRDIMQFP